MIFVIIRAFKYSLYCYQYGKIITNLSIIKHKYQIMYCKNNQHLCDFTFNISNSYNVKTIYISKDSVYQIWSIDNSIDLKWYHLLYYLFCKIKYTYWFRIELIFNTHDSRLMFKIFY